jgi:phosphatidylglycerol lysyltransferase
MTRRLILYSLAIAFVWLVISRFNEIQNLGRTLAQGQLQWVAAAVLLQMVYFITFAASYQAAFTTVEVRSRVLELVPVVFGSLFVNVIAPAGGSAGAALFVDDATQRGESSARAAAGTMLQLVADFGAFILVLVVGLVYLFLQHHLKAYQVVGAILLFLITLGWSGFLTLGLWRPTLLRGLLTWFHKLINGLAGRLGRPNLLGEDWAHTTAVEFTGAATAISRHPQELFRTLAVALAAHLVDIASLFALFLAFNQPIGLGPLVAGFAMGIVFWVVSITPQGIGVVEGVMVLVYTSLGIPAATATVVVLAFRGLTFWLPLLLGFVLLRRMRTFGAQEQTLARVWQVRVVALLTAVMGVINVLSALTPAFRSRMLLLDGYLPLEVRHGGRLTAVLAGFALLLLAGSLWRRKRTAWLLTMGVLVIAAFSNLIKGLDYEEALLAAGLALWLGLLHAHFQARSDPPSIVQGLRSLLGALVFTVAYGLLGFYLLDHHYRADFGFYAALRQTVIMFTQFYDPGLQPITRFGRYFAGSIYIVGAATFGYALFMLVRPVLIRRPATPEERARARQIVENYGRSSLAHMALFNDKFYHFSSGGSVISFVVKGGVALALGDPIGPQEDADQAIAGFKSLCSANDWRPAFYQTQPDYLKIYQANGLDLMCIGHEAIVNLADFTLEGGANKKMRTAVNRLTREGYRAQIYLPPQSDLTLELLRDVSDEWLALAHGSEKRFSVGWFDDDYMRGSIIMAAHAPDETIMAFANLVPEYQQEEVSLDLMRHRQEVIGGTMDFLIVKMVEWAREVGYATFNLGLSAFSGVGERTDDPAVERAMHYIYEHINQFYNFKGLHEFKEKFHPQWSPRYLVFPGTANLPGVVLAIARADSGDSLLEYIRT